MDVTFEAVTAAHYQNTRTLPPGRSLVVSDTTEICDCRLAKRSGMLPLAKLYGTSLQFLHSIVSSNIWMATEGTKNHPGNTSE